MPNGNDKNWVRVRVALEGFFLRHGRWPTRMRLYPAALADLRDHLFLPASWARLSRAIEFVEDESAAMIAMDDAGNRYAYGEDFGWPRPRVTAEEWLGVAPDAPDARD